MVYNRIMIAYGINACSACGHGSNHTHMIFRSPFKCGNLTIYLPFLFMRTILHVVMGRYLLVLVVLFFI